SVATDLVRVEPVDLRSWLESLRPVRLQLLAALADIFKDSQRREIERTLATSVLGDYAAHQPKMPTELRREAEPQQSAAPFPKLPKYGETARALLQTELQKKPQAWTDSPWQAAWKEPASEVKERIEAAYGMLADRFAFCQTMPLEEFIHV